MVGESNFIWLQLVMHISEIWQGFKNRYKAQGAGHKEKHTS